MFILNGSGHVQILVYALSIRVLCHKAVQYLQRLWTSDLEAPLPALYRQHMQSKVKNMPSKSNRTCSNLPQATQKVANDMAGICHVILHTLRALCIVSK